MPSPPDLCFYCGREPLPAVGARCEHCDRAARGGRWEIDGETRDPPDVGRHELARVAELVLGAALFSLILWASYVTVSTLFVAAAFFVATRAGILRPGQRWKFGTTDTDGWSGSAVTRGARVISAEGTGWRHRHEPVDPPAADAAALNASCWPALGPAAMRAQGVDDPALDDQRARDPLAWALLAAIAGMAARGELSLEIIHATREGWSRASDGAVSPKVDVYKSHVYAAPGPRAHSDGPIERAIAAEFDRVAAEESGALDAAYRPAPAARLASRELDDLLWRLLDRPEDDAIAADFEAALRAIPPDRAFDASDAEPAPAAAVAAFARAQPAAFRALLDAIFYGCGYRAQWWHAPTRGR